MKPRAILFLAIALGALNSAQGQTEYSEEVEKWRSERETNLKKKTGG
jgi:hypothetical protein